MTSLTRHERTKDGQGRVDEQGDRAKTTMTKADDDGDVLMTTKSDDGQGQAWPGPPGGRLADKADVLMTTTTAHDLKPEAR